MKAIHFMRIAFAVFVIIPALLVAASCDSEGKHEKDEQRKREEIESKVQADLASKYGASVDWHKKLDERKILDTPYSIDMEEALILLNNKPIVFDAFVEDVTKSDNKYFVRLDYSGSPQIYFILECKPELAAKILSSRQGLDQIVVVATISSVKRPSIKLESESPSSEDPPDIDVTTSDMFIAKGIALDFEFLK